MRAAFLCGVLDVQAEGMPVPEIEQPDDVLIEVSHAGVLLTLHPMDGIRSVLAPAIVPVQTATPEALSNVLCRGGAALLPLGAGMRSRCQHGIDAREHPALFDRSPPFLLEDGASVCGTAPIAMWPRAFLPLPHLRTDVRCALMVRRITRR